MTERAHGIDVSTWQGEMDWKVAGAKVDFAFIRAGSINGTTGVLYEDYQFIRNSGLAPVHVDYLDYYWYFRPNLKVLEQADYFSNLIKGAKRNLRPIADVETTGGLSPNAVASALEIFVRRIKENLGVWPMIYTRTTFWNPYVGDRTLWEELDLDIARYTSAQNPWGYTGNPNYLKPRDWDDWDFWQYSADGNGMGAAYGAKSASIDLQHFNGSKQDLVAYSVAIYPPAIPDLIYVKRKRNTILYEMMDTYHYKSVLHEGHQMVVDGIHIRESDGAEFYVVGDGLVRADHCAIIN